MTNKPSQTAQNRTTMKEAIVEELVDHAIMAKILDKRLPEGIDFLRGLSDYSANRVPFIEDLHNDSYREGYNLINIQRGRIRKEMFS